MVKIHRDFSKTTGSVLIYLNTRQPWVKGIKIFTNKGPPCSQRKSTHSFTQACLLLRTVVLGEPYSSCASYFYGLVSVVDHVNILSKTIRPILPKFVFKHIGVQFLPHLIPLPLTWGLNFRLNMYNWYFLNLLYYWTSIRQTKYIDYNDEYWSLYQNCKFHEFLLIRLGYTGQFEDTHFFFKKLHIYSWS